MKTFIVAAAGSRRMASFAQPAPTTAGPARIYTEMPAGTTVTKLLQAERLRPFRQQDR